MNEVLASAIEHYGEVTAMLLRWHVIRHSSVAKRRLEQASEKLNCLAGLFGQLLFPSVERRR